MRLNLILNNLVHSLPNVVHDDMLENPRHLSADKRSIRQFDYIVTNPPFKAVFSDSCDKLADKAYRKRLWADVPNITSNPDNMEIYLMFLQHVISSMKGDGRAALVVPTGFLTTKKRLPFAIRNYMIERKMLRGVVSMPNNIFATTSTNVSAVFLDASHEYDHALLMDASKLGTKQKVDGNNQRTFLSAGEIERIVEAFNAAEESDSFSVLASYEDIEAKQYSFSAGQYFEVKMEYINLSSNEFDAELTKRMNTLCGLFDESDCLRDWLFPCL